MTARGKNFRFSGVSSDEYDKITCACCKWAFQENVMLRAQPGLRRLFRISRTENARQLYQPPDRIHLVPSRWLLPDQHRHSGLVMPLPLPGLLPSGNVGGTGELRAVRFETSEEYERSIPRPLFTANGWQ